MRTVRSKFDVKKTREEIVFPMVAPDYHSYEECDVHARPRLRDMYTDRAFAPYQPGETMLVEIGGKTRLARVTNVFHYVNRWNDCIPKWRVQLATKDGYWSQNWQYVYPGDVYRAYHDGEIRREIPSQIDFKWLQR